jgi:magnesium-transporting ATPase (P-type)
MYILAISVGGWILLLQTCILRFVRNAWFESHPSAMFYALVVYAAITALFYRILIINEVDQKISEKYADAWYHNPNKKRDMVVVFFVAAAPYILMMFLKMFFPR